MPLIFFFNVILSLVIVLSACRFQVYQPKTYNAESQISPYRLNTASYQELPNLDLALMIIDQQTFNLADLYLNPNVAASNDVIVVDGSIVPENIVNHPQDLTNLTFKAVTDVYCVSGQCQGVKMSGFADVDINLETFDIKVTNLRATNQINRMVLSGSIERISTDEFLQNIANAELVLTIDQAIMIMDKNAQIQFYKSMARNGILEAIFSAKNEDFSITLSGNLNSR